MVYPNDHIAEVRSEGTYVDLQRDNDRFGDGIDVVWGVLPEDEAGPEGGRTEIQSLRFDTNQFSKKEAKDWLEKYDLDVEFFMQSGQDQTQDPANDGDTSTESERVNPEWEDWALGVLTSVVFGAALRSALQSKSS
jgi:hypothetical protein